MREEKAPAGLDRLPLGKTGVVKEIRAGGGMGRRLMDLGFVPGAHVECLLAAPGGGMRAYRVRRAVIALRQADARNVVWEEETACIRRP